VFSCALPISASAQGGGNKFSPTIITNEAGETAIGFDFEYDNKFFGLRDGDSVPNTPVVAPQEDVLNKAFLLAKGSVSLNPSVRPKELISISAGYERLRVYQNRDFLGIFEAVGFDAQVSHETNQDLDQSKTGGGILGIASYDGVDWQYAISLGADYILSDSDKERKLLVTDNNYWRLGGEFNLGYKLELGNQNLLLAWNYRYFHEVDAATAIKDGRLENFRLSNLKLTFINTNNADVYVSYSTGKLPFDHAEDRVYKLGLDYKF